MRHKHRTLYSYVGVGWLVLCAAGCTAETQSAEGLAGTVMPPQPVAVATIRHASASVAWPVLPVTVNGKTMTVMLDLGTTDNMLPGSGDGPPLDSLILGTTVEHHVEYDTYNDGFDAGDATKGLPPVIGLLGTPILRHYDFLFDGPSQRVSIYGATNGPFAATARHPADWLPPGFTAADCTPMTPDPDSTHRVFFALQANGQAIHSMFDPGTDFTNINLAAANVLGLTQHTPGMHRLPRDSAPQFSMYAGQKVWEVPGVVLHIGTHTLTPIPIHIYQDLPRETDHDDPELSLGLKSLSDRVFFVSYSGTQVCLDQR